MEYISILVLIVGFIFSMLQKDKKTRSKRIPTEHRQYSIPAEEADAPKNRNVAKANEEPIKDAVQQELERLKKEKAWLEKKLKSIEIHTIHKQKNTFETKNEDNGLFSKNKLVDAVILSEVLSSPRAKSGYRMNTRKGVSHWTP
ncbi:hypothetical protein [Niallia sp. 03133]|uniref:hypothetical protein n=1 Tax=Niallia sp. 03133 TaxID=3458060 RepID=UPI0040450F6E